MSEIRTIRIFISSPGDVFEERTLAQRVIERVQAEFAGRAVLEPVFWEHEPLLATDTFQTQITMPSEADIMVAILWSRLGTRLPKNFTRNDGSRFESGTEFEFENAVEAFREHGKPQLLVYRKTARASVQLDDEKALMDRVEQKRKLDDFIARWFHHTEDGSLKAAFHPFESPSEFEQVLERHLRKMVLRALPESDHHEQSAAAVWKKGSPFRGLQSFHFEHAPIFFGRTRAIGDVLDLLRRQAADGPAFVLLLGMSGGGKSSLARAGVLPMLTQPGVIEGVGHWRRAVFRPSDVHGDLFVGLATAILREPGLKLEDTGADEFAEVLRSSPAAAVTLIKTALARYADERSTSTPDQRPPETRLALVIDQMEEIFTQGWITPEDRERFIDTVDVLARCGRVWIVATFRADMYPRCASLPKLVSLKEGSGQYDLMPPTATEIGQMVRLPTRAAGLRFEEDFTTNERLDDMLRDAAAARPELLPLLQFTLEELYQRRREDGTLTLEAYRDLGGVEGSLARRAETVFEQLPTDVQAELPRALDALIHIRREGQETIGRRRARQSDFETPEARQLIDAFIDARLFVTELDEDGEASVMVTHEALLWHWPRVKEWIEQNRENLRIHSRINAGAERWNHDNRNPDLLLPSGKPLYEATSLLDQGATLTSNESAFIEASLAAARKRRNIKRGVTAALAVLAIMTSLTAIFANRQRQLADAERHRAEIEAETAQRASDFLVELFEDADPSEARGKEVTAGEILETGVARIDRELSDEPEIQARLLETMGKVYVSLGALNEAEPMLRRALEIRRRLPADAAIEVASGLHHLGHALALRAKLAEAEQALEEALAIRRREYGQRHPAVAETLTWLAYVKGQAGDYAAAEPLLREALEMRREVLGHQHLDVAQSLQELGMNQFDQGNFDAAEDLLFESLEMRRELLGTEPHPALATSLNNLALVLATRGDAERGEALFREALEMKQAMLPEANNEIAVGMNNLAILLRRTGKLDEARDMYKQAIAIQEQVLGPTHTEVARTMRNLAVLLHTMDRTEEAIGLARRALEIRELQHDGDHPEIALIQMSLGQWLSAIGESEEAETRLRASLAMRERLLAPGHPDLTTSRMVLANHLIDQGRSDEACRMAQGSVAALVEAFGSNDTRVAMARSVEGACLLAASRHEEAEASLLAGLEGLDVTTTSVAARRQTLRRLVRLYEDWDRPDKASRYRRRLSESGANTSRKSAI
ncbi:MAG: tetratricopeptide repeat protein [Wenzhouxiangellaceae bacterium]|nr:tetratricopeptide repeat protein [Wenzhouxiangellaceae bacterium]